MSTLEREGATMGLGREQVDWSQDAWEALDDAVHDEFHRAAVALKFIPFHGQLDNAMTVPSDVVDLETMTVDETAVTALVELGVEFGLTRQQIATEELNLTGVALATRAANLLAQAEDLVLFLGEAAFREPIFKKVQRRSGAAGTGLLGAAAQAVTVVPVSDNPKRYVEHTFDAVVEAYSLLQRQGHNGPYALVLRSEVYADSFASLPSSLVTPADRIAPLVSLGLFGTGTLPTASGLMVSVGGNTMDLVVGIEPTTEFLQVGSDGSYRFRVFERFALRVKDPGAVVRFDFK
jgi:uncharacterized linocin/CFP29 family protein